MNWTLAALTTTSTGPSPTTRRGQYDLAIDDCNKVIELDPNRPRAYENRAIAYFEMQQYDLAIADCNKCMELVPNTDWVYYFRGLIYKEQGKKAEAIADFQKCLTLTANPQLIEAANQQIEELSR